MIRNLIIILILFQSYSLFSQSVIDHIDFETISSNQVSHFWLILIDNEDSQSISVPMIIAKGKYPGPTLGLIAAIHGNELNGNKVIHELLEDLDTNQMHGTIVAIPGLNQIGMANNSRRYNDDEDLNRQFPGKEYGNESQQFVWQVNKKILTKIDYLIDMHTASFGRINSLYVRADMSDDKIQQMALLQGADIVLNGKGSSTGAASSTRTMREEAMLKGIPTITVEYGNPQVYQDDMIVRGVIGVKNVINWLKMQEFETLELKASVRCKKSYWIYVDKGGLLEIPVKLNQILEKGDLIGILRNSFGDVIKEYTCPEKGIVIGKSTNPVNMSGGRIIHLGIPED